MGVMCNNSFVIYIKTEGHSLDVEDIEKALKKKFGRYTPINVKEYIPPTPSMKIPELKKKAGDWSVVIKPSGKKKKETKEKVYCSNCKHYNDVLGVDCLADPDKSEYEDNWYKRERVIVNPSIKNKNNNCKDFESKHKNKE